MTEKFACDKCGTIVSIDYRYCPNCGVAIDEEEEILLLRYPALRTIAGFYQLLAFVVVILAVTGIVYALLNLRMGNGALIILGLSILVGTIGAVTFFAVAEGIRVFLDIEENTRRAARRRARL